MVDIYGMMRDTQQSAQDGYARGQKTRLAGLVQQSMQAPRDQRQGLLAQMAGIDPQAAYNAEGHFKGMDDTARARLGEYASAFDALPDEQKAAAYPQLAKQAQQLGIPAPPEWNPAYAPHIQKLAQTLGGGGLGGNVQSTYINAQGQRVAIMRDGSQKTLGDANASIQVMEQEGQLPYGVVKSGGVPGTIVPLGGGAPAPRSPIGTGGQVSGATRVNVEGVPPEQGQRIASMAELMRNQGFPEDEITNFVAYQSGQYAQQPQAPAASGGGPVPVKTSGQKALEAEAAKQSVEIGNLPLRGQIDARNAALKAQAEAAAKAQAERDSVVANKQVDANKTLSLLDEAEKLIPGSTGSGAGNIIDAIAGAGGYSTDGAKNIAALQTIAGQLTSSMPRMQGPQSDKDVQLYRQMAGDLANPNLPRDTRMAALKTIRRLNQKYAGGNGDAPQSKQIGSGGWSIQRVP